VRRHGEGKGSSSGIRREKHIWLVVIINQRRSAAHFDSQRHALQDNTILRGISNSEASSRALMPVRGDVV